MVTIFYCTWTLYDDELMAERLHVLSNLLITKLSHGNKGAVSTVPIALLRKIHIDNLV